MKRLVVSYRRDITGGAWRFVSSRTVHLPVKTRERVSEFLTKWHEKSAKSIGVDK
jgi:hypothetical protein